MLNAPHNSLLDASAEIHGDDWLRCASPWRVYSVGMSFCLAALIVLGRIAWVQGQLPDDYLAALETTSVEYEVIPARDGRILADSVVLAADVEHYELQLHYRWLQEPVSDDWLQQQVRNRLTRDERRDEELVQRVRSEVLAEREQMLKAFCDAAGITREELRDRCEQIQAKVERIADAVNRRHAQAPEFETDEDDEGVLMRMASAVRSALTTPPRRVGTSRIVVREEEMFHTVVDEVPLAVAALVSEHPEMFPGVRAYSRTTRTYPEGSLAAHVVGARTPLKDDERGPEQPSDGRVEGEVIVRQGRFGVERSYNDQVAGTHGLRRIVRDRRQRIVSDEILREPASGQDIVLTLDPRLQQLCEQLLREALLDAPLDRLLPRDEDEAAANAPQPVPVGGSIVAMEAATGRILAAASGPSFDLKLFTAATQAEWDASNNDPRRPFIARFTGMALPPGSTFKTLTAVAALESGTITPQASLFCQGYLDNPGEHRCLIFRMYGSSHSHLNVKTALAQSCNVFFFEVARQMGIRTLADWTDRLQFGQPTGIDLPYEKSGTVPKPPGDIVQTSTSSASRFEREALGLAIGQSRLTVTPLQMARLMAVIANGGWLVTPHVVSEEGIARSASDLSAIPAGPQRLRMTDLHEETITTIREGLKATVQNPAGTGYRDVRIDEVDIAGKTGTAETAPNKADHAWFAGYLPADDPQIVIVVVLEHGGSGSHTAGPVAREVSREIARLGLAHMSGD